MTPIIHTSPGIKTACVCMLLSTIVSTHATEVKNMDDAMKYMKQYFMGPNYSNEEFGQLVTSEETAAVLSSYQRFMGLKVTGRLDDQTISMMEKPRCGREDKLSMADDVKRRRKRYTLEGSKWNNNSPLTYRFKTSTYSTDLSNSVVFSIMAKAFEYWSDVTNIDFRYTSSTSADIDILFASGEHDGEGPSGAFDGSGGTLAHAYFPQYGGDAHFDEDETWTTNTNSGINLLQVAVHEIGHSLGLSHSTVQGAIMFPSYLGYVPNFSLHSDDISGIQAIYGVRSTTASPGSAGTTTTSASTTTTTTTTTTTNSPITTTTPQDGGTVTPSISNYQRFCQNLKFDAITTFNGRTYAFKDDLYVELDNSGILPGYPRRISDDWPGAPDNIDAALYWPENNPPRLYIFKGSRYWRYETSSSDRIFLRSNYPRLITNGFRGIPDDIDSAFVWGRNGKTYIFKDPNYYRLYRDPQSNITRGQVDPGYPRNTRGAWRLPKTYDAVFRWRNGRTYFFDGDSYVRYNDFQVEIDTNANPPYPRSIDGWWTNCGNQNLQHIMEMDSKGDKEFIVVEQENDNDHFVTDGADTVQQTALAVVMVAVLTMSLL